MRTSAAWRASVATLAGLLLAACTESGGSVPPKDPSASGAGAPAQSAGAAGSTAAAEPALRLVATTKLPGVRGRIDHLARDAGRGRLFVAALGNGSVEVISIARSECERSIEGLAEPQGIAFVATADVLAVACGGDGTVRLFDGEKLAPAESGAKVKLGMDADNVRWNEATKRLWIAFGEGGLASIDPAKPAASPASVSFDVHPEGFQVETSGRRAYVNLAANGEVAACDLATGKVSARWKLGDATANYPMALDETNGRVYSGCRSPARLVVVSTGDGKVVAAADCTGDPDDVFLDAARKRVYVICGEGSVDVFDVSRAAPRLAGRIATPQGARTALFEDDRLWLAVPAQPGSEAEIREFEPLPR